MQLCESVERFMMHCEGVRRLAAHTLRAYRQDLAHLLAFVKSRRSEAADAANWRRGDVRAYIEYMTSTGRLRTSSVRRHVATVRSMFNWLAREGLVESSPFRDIDLRLTLPKPLPRCLTEDEVATFVRHVAVSAGFPGPRQYEQRSNGRPRPEAITTLVAVELLLATGIRVGELCKIRTSDTGDGWKSVTISGKGSRERRVFITSSLIQALVRWYAALPRPCPDTEADAYLMRTAVGTRASEEHIRSYVTSAAERAGLKRRVTPHMLRHTCATELLETGLDIRFVQRLLGHRSITTTQIYTNVTDVSLRQALERATDTRMLRIAP